MRRIARLQWRLAAVGLLVCVWTAGGCASAGRSGGDPLEAGAPTSEGAVTGFLEAANRGDYERMAALFGTGEGPAVDRFGVADVEQRMIFLSRLLRHERRSLRVANLRRLGPDRIRYEARLEGTRRGDITVPVVTVPARGSRWFVERLDVSGLAGEALP